MAFDIRPGEFFMRSEHYVIQTIVPVEEIQESMVLARVQSNGLAVGDKVLVQCMNHEKDTLLGQAEYLITRRKESLQRIARSDTDIRQINHVDYAIVRLGDWWLAESGPASIEHIGRGNYRVLDAQGEELCAVTKDEGGKALAEDILAGKTPVVA
jgi:hypothetical protein